MRKDSEKDSSYSNAGTLLSILLTSSLLLGGCARPPPANTGDACTILEDRKDWYYASIQARNNWGMPVAVMLSFIHQESSFKARAKTERTRLFGIIPWKRTTTAYGYAQAIDSTWEQYKKEAGRKFARRSSFSDATDFIGWYNHKSVKTLGLSPRDAYNLYLAYHEGWSGYRKKTHLKKPWLIEAAKKVRQRTDTYARQLKRCAGRLKVPWYRLFGTRYPPDQTAPAAQTGFVPVSVTSTSGNRKSPDLLMLTAPAKT